MCICRRLLERTSLDKYQLFILTRIKIVLSAIKVVIREAAEGSDKSGVRQLGVERIFLLKLHQRERIVFFSL
jgi:hypothetical protein